MNFLDLKDDQCNTLDRWPDNTICLIEDFISEDHLCKLFDKLGVPAYIMHNGVLWYDLPDPYAHVPVFCLPIHDDLQHQDFQNLEISSDLPDTQYNFCFSANRATINRYLCIKLVQYFQLTNFDYTWSGCGREFDCSGILASLSAMNMDKKHFLGPIDHFASRWIDNGQKVEKTRFQIHYKTTNVQNYLHVKPLYDSALFQLILGSANYEKLGWFCEKSGQALLSMNIPIFVGGGYKQAEAWRSLGYDVFDDIVDHSYETEPDLFKRCYLAFELNQHLLRTPNFCEIRRDLYPRLLDNQRKVLHDNLCKKYIQKKLHSVSENMRQAIVNKIYPYTLNQNSHHFNT